MYDFAKHKVMSTKPTVNIHQKKNWESHFELHCDSLKYTDIVLSEVKYIIYE